MLITGDHGRPARASRTNIGLLKPLVAIMMAAYFVPFLAPLIVAGRLTSELPGTGNTQITSLAAAALALLIFRRVTIYPGARAFGFILPAFSTTFGIAAAILLALRIPYSGAMLLTGYLASVSVAFLLGYFDHRAAPRRLYYVPTGKTGIVGDTPQVEWIKLASPTVPDDPQASIVADLRSTHSPEWERMIAQAAISGIPVYHTKQLRESLTGRVQIEHLSENSFGSLLPALAYRGAKRTIDVVASLVLLPVLFLPLLVVALLVRLSSPGPILFRQRRMGYRGVPFDMLKFRTMVDRAVDDGNEAARHAAITRDEDDRITRIGRFLRRSRIDELPQIINILRGEMSWIGPRPEAVPLSTWYENEIPFYRYRHIVRPGITGWAQVNQGHVAELDDVHVKLHYDFYYIKFFSFWLDVLIAIRTVSIMLTGFGAK
ncbi:Sugar transferase involved in LPS biosynthesis (colanic, teichoic acid) [Sphingomonas gellani]|uniref:Sugar transferase involved in LPS biosynthesis (Colanic, teichoic acid) n=1 Tax=Sphingomonas gellani TaxID=1166340 RepID=A0A1H8I2W4_9SPHN|nr:sugar transferase [Sphingomonas gellani]SEN62652.1 Sugar transferase involved in LPS biosynthesis (colanic, teichoic acid) [Sphingomonas gellani]